MSLMSSALLARRKFFQWLAGIGFEGSRDYYKVLGYPRAVTSADLLAAYERQDIVGRVVDMPPETTWIDPPKIKGPANFMSAWEKFSGQQDVWTTLMQADRLLYFDRFSVVYLGGEGAPDTEMSPDSSIRFLTAYGCESVAIQSYEKDRRKPTFGMPSLYRLSTGDGEVAPGANNSTIDVHPSRIVHICDRPLQGRLFSTPRLTQVFNVLADLLKLTGGSAEVFWLLANQGMQIDVDKDMDLSPDDEKNLEAELEEYQHQLRRYIRTRGVTVTPLGSSVADPRGTFDVLISLLSAATGIPQRLLVGSEAGQLASEQDRANWADYIQRRRISFAQPYALRRLIQSLQAVGQLPATDFSKLTFEWPSAFHVSPLEAAQTMAQTARAVVNLSRQGLGGFPFVGVQEARRIVGLDSEPPIDDPIPEFPIPGSNKGGMQKSSEPKKSKSAPEEEPASSPTLKSA